ncbi:MAG: hypothetical protein AAGI66_02860 [Cyanobacteria bacterium P01_H01_bin.74]
MRKAIKNNRFLSACYALTQVCFQRLQIAWLVGIMLWACMRFESPAKNDPEQNSPVPVSISLNLDRSIFSKSQAIPVEVQFIALRPVALCLSRNLHQHFRFDLAHAVLGKLAFQPVFVASSATDQSMPVVLAPGETLRRWVNLKALSLQPERRWPEGEYSVSAEFFLCENNLQDQAEQNIPASNTARFMIAL